MSRGGGGGKEPLSQPSPPFGRGPSGRLPKEAPFSHTPPFPNKNLSQRPGRRSPFLPPPPPAPRPRPPDKNIFHRPRLLPEARADTTSRSARWRSCAAGSAWGPGAGRSSRASRQGHCAGPLFGSVPTLPPPGLSPNAARTVGRGLGTERQRGLQRWSSWSRTPSTQRARPHSEEDLCAKFLYIGGGGVLTRSNPPKETNRWWEAPLWVVGGGGGYITPAVSGVPKAGEALEPKVASNEVL